MHAGVIDDVEGAGYLLGHLFVQLFQEGCELCCCQPSRRLPLEGLQKRGRPRTEPPPALVAAFDVEANSKQGLQLGDLYKTLKRKVFWRCSCTAGRQHLHYCQPESVWRRWERDRDSFQIECLLCNGTRKFMVPISDHEEAAREAAAAAQHALPSPHVMAEVRVLGETMQQRYAAADLVMLKQVGGKGGGRLAMLAIMVDGEQHFSAAFQEQSVAAQQIRDRRFDQAALRQGFPVLRLHHRDWGQYTALVTVAFSKACEAERPFVTYSSSYECGPVGAGSHTVYKL